jgi:hypothetical protein
MAMVGSSFSTTLHASNLVRNAVTNKLAEKLTGLKRQLVEAARERRPGS